MYSETEFKVKKRRCSYESGVANMRSEKEMMELLLGFAEQDGRIRLMTLEGSRTNVNIPKDSFQDFDVSYFVTDMKPYLADDGWLQYFGNIIMMQKPDAMDLFEPAERGFSYLMLFDDYNKMDLTLYSLEDLDEYLRADKLVKVLLDKDQRIKQEIIPTDIDYHVKQPTAKEFDDSCNEFWHVVPYVVKGLCRREILFAIDHLYMILRRELLRMLAWKVGFETGFSLSIGKNCKFLDKYIPKDLWNRLLSTYRLDSYENVWASLFECMQLFREVSREVSELLGCAYPEYDRNVMKYTMDMYEKYRK